MDDSEEKPAGTAMEGADSRQQPAGTDGTGEDESVEIHPPHQPIHSAREFLVQLVTITAGVLIALSLEGVLEWNHYRMLVREARDTIAREIRQQEGARSHAGGHGQTAERPQCRAATGERVAGDEEVRHPASQPGVSFAELSMASWQTAERTGALAHMEYSEVQDYSRLYGAQQLFADRQAQMLERIAGALAIMGAGDPHSAPVRDLELFRQQVLALRGDLAILQQLGRQLAGLYGEAAAVE